MLKTSPLALSLFLALSAIGCASAESRTANPPSATEEEALETNAGPRPNMAKFFFKKFDTNADGVLDATEVAAMPERARDKAAEADADKDGKVTLAEAEAHIEKMRKSGRFHHRAMGRRGGEFLKTFDKNDDKVFDSAEVAAMPERMREHILQADADKDGKVTVDELQAQRKNKGHERFVKQDKNADGFLTQDEVGEKRWNHIVVADSNKDDKISEAELIQAHKDGKLGRRHGGGRHKKDAQ